MGDDCTHMHVLVWVFNEWCVYAVVGALQAFTGISL